MNLEEIKEWRSIELEARLQMGANLRHKDMDNIDKLIVEVERLSDELNTQKFRTCERCVEKTAARCAEIADWHVAMDAKALPPTLSERSTALSLDRAIGGVHNMGFYRDGQWQPDATEIAAGEYGEINKGGIPVKNASYWKRQADQLRVALDNMTEVARLAQEAAATAEIRAVTRCAEIARNSLACLRLTEDHRQKKR